MSINKPLILIMLSLLLLAVTANAYERLEFQDGLADKWHPGAFCIPCHYTLLGDEKAKAISNNCFKCHAHRPKDAKGGYEVDMTNILELHKDIVCIRCHVGTKNQVNMTATDFHMIKSKIACEICHTSANGTYLKPPTTRCSACHGIDPHVVHGKKLEKICVACHGEFGEEYIKASEETMKPPSILEPEPVIKGYTTIGEFMSKIIESVVQMIR